MWNQTNQFLLQVMNVSENKINIEPHNKHMFQKYVDSIEILGHISYSKNK